MLSNSQPILIYLLIFLALSVVLKLFGVIDVTNIELLGYAFIFYGITMVYTSFGKNQSVILFSGSSLFLTGLLLFLLSNFDFTSSREIIFPAILFILGIDFLMLFLDNTIRKNYLAISVTAILSAITVTILLWSITFQNFLTSIENITAKYWPVVIIAAGLLVLLSLEHKRK
jgi:hypothetical protein